MYSCTVVVHIYIISQMPHQISSTLQISHVQRMQGDSTFLLIWNTSEAMPQRMVYKSVIVLCQNLHMHNLHKFYETCISVLTSFYIAAPLMVFT